MANQYQNIVVAVDGSKEAELAFRKAIDVATRNVGSTLHIVHVIDTSVSTSIEMLYDNMFKLVLKHGEVLVENYRTEAIQAGVTNVKTIIKNGVPKTILTKKLAEFVPVDLIICGATGSNAAEQFFIGSNTAAIVRHAKCDVLVVRTPE